MKKCIKCDEEKPHTEFSRHNTATDGLYKKCKVCIREETCPETPPNPLGKTCSVCKEYKLEDSYRYKKNGKWGLTSQCNSCISEKHKNNSLVEKTPEYDEKVCCQCGVEQLLEFYTKDSYKKDGYRPECNQCKIKNRLLRRDRELETGRDYYIKNQEALKQKYRQYYKDNTEKAKECSKKSNKKYRENNREKVNAQVKKCYEKNKQKYFETNYERKRTDPLFKLKCNIRTLLSGTFKKACNGEFSKGEKTTAILGCTMEDLYIHIENQLSSWMNWDNYGKCDSNEYNCSFSLDHIIPISYAKNEEEIYLLNHWSNFQPLCSKVNSQDKSATVYPCTNLELRITFWEDYWEHI